MIDWTKTEEIFGITNATARTRDKVIVYCDKCTNELHVKLANYNRAIKLRNHYHCRTCAASDPDKRQRLSDINKTRMAEPGAKQRISDATKTALWRPNTRQKYLIATSSQEWRQKWLTAVKESMAKPEVRDKIKRRWQDSDYRQQFTIRLASNPNVSTPQRVLYSALDDIGVEYYREYETSEGITDRQCIIGPWTFDCVVPRPGRPTLLIECQGDYWHNNADRQRRDSAKANYIATYHHSTYELKHIWEHEFLQSNRIVEILRYWLGLYKPDLISYTKEEINIRECEVSDCKLLFAKYHYLQNCRRGGIVYGAYIGDELIASCVFSPLVRQNIAGSLGHDAKEIRELSRFCIHPRYQTKNLASWFISRCIKKLPRQYKLIISYCDTTFNHVGAVYKASNFILNSEIPPDYWYATEDGWVMHKRTLYGHAIKMGMTEDAFAKQHNYVRVTGLRKLRFVFNR